MVNFEGPVAAIKGVWKGQGYALECHAIMLRPRLVAGTDMCFEEGVRLDIRGFLLHSIKRGVIGTIIKQAILFVELIDSSSRKA